MSKKPPPVRWLSPDEERAWRAFRRMMIAVQTGTARDLSRAGLSEPDYEVLSTLSERPDHAGTLHEQAAKMGWSRSRLSRHATRMEARGLIRREPDPDDGRGCILVLTEHGLDTLTDAAPAHLESVRHHFIDRLAPEDLTALEHIASKVETPGEPHRP
ncbi:MarR family winged helix-turn-helix transcriptional regulator [Actinomadura madurae]|uniref:MarR family winged helix-turn-helix transcriptional regulator n=1 Tax=Actinomadura madurae TaxID=1993 RepID=UPI0020D220D3|nr:MarR family winged helix-turn-helix transcriptional regulator [Actinomadura madurae]MCP9951064.1 MarR family winged helix-turn-helix transcriptional regulator [Actinomadura madurae]MCP9980301.1 MarR family winged helix-turn-helix transcriptional regulator [Actinomadura madurae]MCQ0016510.1 MarR family winged helix-turn-helix transcriptional regulator [Actinomadura madurae]